MSSRTNDDDSSSDNIEVSEFYSNDRAIVKIEKNGILKSSELQREFRSEIDEIEISCNSLQIDDDLPSSYRGKNIFIFTDAVDVLKKSVWNLSGKDGATISTPDAAYNEQGLGCHGCNGNEGENGGSIQIVFNEQSKISQPSLLTIESNGGNGANGQNGGCGKDGENGKNVQLSDFTYKKNPITYSNFRDIFENTINIDCFEDGFEKKIIFDGEKGELLMLIKGSKGEKGKCGGKGGEGGRGGNPGDIKVFGVKCIGKVGQAGKDGENGFNGKDGRDGTDAYMIIQADEDEPIYGGLNLHKKYKLQSSENKMKNSVYYKPINKYFYITADQEAMQIFASLSDTKAQMTSFEDHKIQFCEALVSVLLNSNDLFYEVITTLNIKMFLERNISINGLFDAIAKNNFDILDYRTLKHYTESLMSTEIYFDDEVIKKLQEYLKPSERGMKAGEIYEIKGKILTTESLENLPSDFKQLDLVCEIFHVNKNQPNNLRGKNIAILANTLHIHDKVEWDLSGWSKITTHESTAEKGCDGESGQNGGDCTIDCVKIINPSLWTIKSNGGDGSNGQDGCNGNEACDGLDPTIDDFKINGEDLKKVVMEYKNKNIWLNTWEEKVLKKAIYIESNDTYLMMVQGSKGEKPIKGYAGGKGGGGGHAGKIKIITTSNIEKDEVNVIAIKGKDGIAGISGEVRSKHGCTLVLYVKNGIKTYLGEQKNYIYEIIGSSTIKDYSVCCKTTPKKYYYPKLIHYAEHPNSMFDNVMMIVYLISVLRNANDEFDDVVNILKLEDFVNNKMTFEEFSKIIKGSNLMIANFKTLQDAASTYKLESSDINEDLRKIVSKYIQKANISTSSHIVTINKNILRSSEFIKYQFKEGVKQFNIICNTLHINSNLPSIFQGKNLVIFARFVIVHDNFIWDLSGSPVMKFETRAGQDNNGRGINGLDGLAGNSGGNFYLECKYIENQSLLNIISNGSDGSDGQNGGNGRNGVNGQDAKDSDFFVDEIELKVPMNKQNFEKLKKSDKVIIGCEIFDLAKGLSFCRGDYVSDNGLKGTFYLRNDRCIVFVRGSEGESGFLGGIGGYGGDGGFPGEITLKCDNKEQKLLRTFGLAGKNGNVGENGWNGIQGRDGGDMYKFHATNMQSPFIGGKNFLTKYKITECPVSRNIIPFSIPAAKIYFNLPSAYLHDEIIEKKLFSYEQKCEIKIEKVNEITVPVNEQLKNKIIISRSKNICAIAKKNMSIEINEVIKGNCQMLEGSLSEISNEISKLEQKALTDEKITKKVEAKKNLKIDIESIKRENADYLQTNFKEIFENLVKKRQQKMNSRITEKFATHGNRSVVADIKKDRKYFKEIRKSLRLTPKLSFEELLIVDIKTNVEGIYDSMRKLNLNKENLTNLLSKINKIKKDQEKKSVNIDAKISLSDVLDLCKEKYLSLIYKDIYNYLNDYQHEIKALEEASTSFRHQNHQLLFMRDTNEFHSSSKHLNIHFELDFSTACKEIVEYFNIICKNSHPLRKFIFLYIIKNKTDEKILQGYRDELEELEKQNDCTKNKDVLYENENFSILLQEFYCDKNIIKYIISELENYGIKSPIYRAILAYEYKLKLAFCKYTSTYGIQIIEYFNYENCIKTQEQSQTGSSYMSSIKKFRKHKNSSSCKIKSSQQPKDNTLSDEIFILMENDKFTILKCDLNSYESYRRKKIINIYFIQIAIILENIANAKAPDMINNSFRNKHLVNFLKFNTEKIKSVDNKFSNILHDEHNEMELYETVLTKFPKLLYTFENNKIVLYEIDSMNELEKSQNISMIDENNEIHRVKHLYKNISKFGGISILKAIAIKFKCNENYYRLKEFSILLESILLILRRREDFVLPLTFMIIGFEQQLWIPELILIKATRLFGFIPKEMKLKWQQILRQDKICKIVSILLKKIIIIDEVKSINRLTIQEFDEIIQHLECFDDNIYEIVKVTNLKCWSTISTDAYWNVNLNKLKLTNVNVHDELKTVLEDMSCKYGLKTRKLLKILIMRNEDIKTFDLINFLKNFTNGQWLLGDNVLDILDKSNVHLWISEIKKNFGTECDKRLLDNILSMIKTADETSDNVKKVIPDIKNQIKEINTKIIEYEKYTESELLDVTKFSNDKLSDLLAVIVIIFKRKANIEIRDTQLISILTMYNSNSGVLMQVSTGEGKTFIGVAFAILMVLMDKKIDIVTSSSVLAERDVTSEMNNIFFKFFNIKVDHNCYKLSDDRKKAYKTSSIVYGTLCNFQRDYLLTEFHEQEIMPKHHFENILVDEVDSMLLDKGNNILYLSQDLPDLDEIEIIFIYIWQWLNQNLDENVDICTIFNTNFIRKVILDRLYGILDESVIMEMHNDINVRDIIKRLKSLQIIDEENVIVKDNFLKNETKIDKLFNGYSEDLIEKVKTYFHNKIHTQKQFRIPNHLKPFVLQHLNQWIESGKKALFLNNANEYIIDTPRTAQLNLDANVNIIDLDTGTDMSDSQWDEGLHQFIQIKYGCRLSPLSLKSVFISNVSFFKKYNKLFGMTGTLGSLQERQKITKIHEIDYVTIPRHVSRKFKELAPIVKFTNSEWLESIHEEVNTIINKNRSVLIICKTIQDTQMIQKEISSSVESENILMYQRDSDDFNIDVLKPHYVIISTNLAGRGTDIKLSEDLNDNGGLHVILTNLPDNSRIEEQAMGRAARSGENGTGRLIIWSTTNEPISRLKEARNQDELKRLDEISAYYENFITIEEKFFKKFQEKYEHLKATLENHNKEIYLLNFVIQWSFWLDRNTNLLNYWKSFNYSEILDKEFEKFLLDKQKLHPVMEIELLKEHKCNSNLLFYNSLTGSYYKSYEMWTHGDNDDLLALNYLKIFQMLKTGQKKNKYKSRELESEEQIQIKKCLRMIQNCINDRQLKIDLVKYLNQKCFENLPPIDGFESQQKEILEIYEVLAKSLKSLMGEDINPNMLASDEINSAVMQTQLYNELLKLKCIKPPQISSNYIVEDLKSVCENNKIEYRKMVCFLQRFKPPKEKINSIKDFEDMLRKNFEIPNRLEFWNILIDKGILKNEIDYVIVDLNAIKKVDPSAGELIEKLENLYESYIQDTKNSIWFSTVDKIQDSEAHQKYVLKNDDLEARIQKKRYNYLKEFNVISTNKKAVFDFEKLESLQIGDELGKFDRLLKKSLNRYKFLKITEKMENSKILILDENGQQSYILHYENFLHIFDRDFLAQDKVYYEQIFEMIKQKFAYTIALKSLVEDIKSGIDNPIIKLETNPYSNLICDLFENYIIEQSKVDETKIHECNNLFKNFDLKDLFSSVDISVDIEFTKELIGVNVLSSEGTNSQNDLDKMTLKITDIDYESIKFSDKYKEIQSTTLLLLDNRRKLLKYSEKIENYLQNWIKPLKKHNSEQNNVVLKPIQDVLSDNNYTNFMKLKGLGTIIRIQERLYTFSFYSQFFWTVGIAVLQVITGVAFTFLFAQDLKNYLIFEGIRDLIFAFSKLKSGYFNWSDLKEHQSKYEANFVVDFIQKLKTSNAVWIERVSKATNNNIYQKKAHKVVTKTNELFNNCRNAIIKTNEYSSVYLLVNEFTTSLKLAIIKDLSQNIHKEFSKHELSRTLCELRSYMKESDLHLMIKNEFPRIQFSFEEAQKIQKIIFNIIENITTMNENLDFCIMTSINLVVKAASTQNFSQKVFANLNSIFMNELIKKKAQINKLFKLKTFDSDKFMADIIKQLDNETVNHYKILIKTTITKPAKNYVDKIIQNQGLKNIEKIVKESTLNQEDFKPDKNNFKMHDEMTTSNENISDDLYNDIHDQKAAWEQFRNSKILFNENINYKGKTINILSDAIEPYGNSLRAEYGSYGYLKSGYLIEIDDVVVHIPAATCEIWINKNGENYKLTKDEMPAIVLPMTVNEVLSADENKSKAFELMQLEYTKNNQLDSAIAMQLIEQHNTTVSLISQLVDYDEIIYSLHSNQENLVEYLFHEGYINHDKRIFLLGVIIDLKISRAKEVENPFLKYPLK